MTTLVGRKRPPLDDKRKKSRFATLATTAFLAMLATPQFAEATVVGTFKQEGEKRFVPNAYVKSQTIDFHTNYVPTADDDLKFLSAGIRYNAASGYCETFGTTMVAGRLTFPQKYPIMITVAPATPTVTFYSDNDIEDNVGAQTVMGTQKFVFKGITLTDGTALGNSALYSGPNFAHNLSKYKVRYSLSNAAITNCILKNQTLRDYITQYSESKPLIKNDGVLSIGNITWTAGQQLDFRISTELGLALSKYRDSCIELISSLQLTYENNHISTKYNSSERPPWEVKAYGIYVDASTSIKVWLMAQKPCLGYYTSSSSYIYSGGSDGNLKLFNISYTPSAQTYSQLSLTNRIDGQPDQNYICLYQYWIQNTVDKLFISNISDDDILYNRGVGLQTLSSDLSTAIKAGNYIVFQGDGELEATVSSISADFSVSNLSAQGITSQETFLVDPSQIPGDDANGYYVDFDMQSIRLISAEILSDPGQIEPISSVTFYPASLANQSGNKVIAATEPNGLFSSDAKIDLLEGSTVLSDFICDSESLVGKTALGVQADLGIRTIELKGDWSKFQDAPFTTIGTGTLKIATENSMPQSDITIRDGATLEFTGNLNYTTGAGTILDLRGCSAVSGGKSLTLGAGGKLIF